MSLRPDGAGFVVKCPGRLQDLAREAPMAKWIRLCKASSEAAVADELAPWWSLLRGKTSREVAGPG